MAKQQKKKAHRLPFNIDDDLRKHYKAEAEANNRSLTGQLNYVLRDYMTASKVLIGKYDPREDIHQK